MDFIPSNPLIPASLFALLLFALVRSLRRQRVDDHPVCRRCGFDLTGRPVGSSVCSECGSDLNRRRAIRLGNRVRRWRVARWVAVPLLLTGAWLGRSGWVASRGMDRPGAKPMWWLKVEARSNNAAMRDAAVTEYIRRLSRNRLSDAQVTALADHALDLQTDPSRPWTPLWGQFLEDAFDAGRLSQDRWERYARQSFDFHLEFRKQVRRGDPVVARIGLVHGRSGPRRLVADAHGLFLDGRERIYDWRQDFTPPAYAAQLSYYQKLQALPLQSTAPRSPRIRENSIYPVPGFAVAVALHPTEFDLSAAPGPQSKSITLKIDVWDARRSTVVTGFPLTLRAGWTLLPAAIPSVALRHDASLRSAIQAAVKVNRVDMRVVPRRPGNQSDVMHVNVDLSIAPTPVDVAFEIWLRHGAVEWKLDEQLARPVRKAERGSAAITGPAPPYFSTSDFVAEFGQPGAKVDVILRPTMVPALLTTDVTEIWGEEVVVKDVPVTFRMVQANAATRPSAATRPASPATTRTSS